MTADRSTKKQQELLQFVDGFTKGNGYSPTYREVMRALGYKSVSTVAVHVDNLIAKGYLRKKDNSARSLEVVTRSFSLEPTTQASTKEQIDWLVSEYTGRLEAFKQTYSREAYDDLQTLVATLKLLAPDDVYQAQAATLEAVYNKHKQ